MRQTRIRALRVRAVGVVVFFSVTAGLFFSPASAALPAATPWYTGLLAAVTSSGDLVLIHPDTARVVRTLVRNVQPPPRPGVGVAPTQISWHTASGTVYFTKACTVWRHRVASGHTASVTRARHAVVSPDGTTLAIWDCSSAPGRVALVSAATGKVVKSLPVSRVPLDQGGAMSYVADIDWRPDGAMLIVTEGWEAQDGARLINLRSMPPSVVEAPGLVSKSRFHETHLAGTEYIGGRLLYSTFCCGAESGDTSSRVVIRDAKTGVLASLFKTSTLEGIDVTADSKGRIRLLRHNEHIGTLWKLDLTGGPARKVGGSFTAIDW